MNALYDAAREDFSKGLLDWTSDDIRAILIDSASYTVSLATHGFLTDVPGGARASTSGSLTTKTSTAGVCDADNVTFTAVAAGPACEAIILYKHTGVEATSRLIAYVDDATNLPITPNGGDIITQWADTANKIFKL